MFSMDDIDNIDIDKRKSQTPDGMIDNSDFIVTMHALYGLISRMDFEDKNERAKFILHLMNMCHDDDTMTADKASNVIMALASHIIIMVVSMADMREQYLDAYYNSMLKDAGSNQDQIPFFND